MEKRKKSLFDSIEMFGRTLPEIFREAGMNEEEIEGLRKHFNKDTKDVHAFRIDTMEQYVPTKEGMEEIKKYDKLSILKESMEKGSTPPEDQGENVW